MTTRPLRVALIGAGSIADVHAEVLRNLPGAVITAVVDPVRKRAEALARRWQIPVVLDDPAELGRSIEVDAAHILTPPPLHRAASEPLLLRGIHVLIEKPMATSEADCEALEDAADRGGARLRINHNFVHHPAFARLRRDLALGTVGRARYVDITYIVQLRQLAGGQLGHWMFRSPLNLLLEQAVHPISQLEALVGPPQDVAAVAEPARRVADAIDLITGWQIAGTAGETSFHMTLVIGHPQPLWRVRVVGSDGILEADMLRNSYALEQPTPWLDAADAFVVGTTAAADRLGQAVANGLAYAGAQLGLRGRPDSFFASMRASIADAHVGFRQSGPDPRPSVGRRLVSFIEHAARGVPRPPQPCKARQCGSTTAGCDVLLIGGTGFIGRHLAARLVGRDLRVGVLARQLEGLPAVFSDPRVVLLRGDVTDDQTTAAIAGCAPVIVHLAQGLGEDWPTIERTTTTSARLLASAARDADLRRLIFVSSIAALYLGDPASVVDPSTSTDQEPEARALYARGKIASEAAYRAFTADGGPPLTIVRPGIVVGRGTSPFHSGIGEFNRQTHCLGWNSGLNPLPLVLASDVAAAIATLVERPEEALPVYNLIGDVRLSARDYIAELGRATGRPLVYRPQSVPWKACVESAKWGVKRLGRQSATRTTLRDLRSRGLVARFDTEREKAQLGWQPVAERARFIAEAFAAV